MSEPKVVHKWKGIDGNRMAIDENGYHLNLSIGGTRWVRWNVQCRTEDSVELARLAAKVEELKEDRRKAWRGAMAAAEGENKLKARVEELEEKLEASRRAGVALTEALMLEKP